MNPFILVIAPKPNAAKTLPPMLGVYQIEKFDVTDVPFMYYTNLNFSCIQLENNLVDAVAYRIT